jgi:hypothetical protein
MDRYDLHRELERTRHRASDPPIHLLALLTVNPVQRNEEYAKRLRSLICEAIKIAQVADFDADEDVQADSLPEWFRLIADGHSARPRGGSPENIGKLNYSDQRDNQPWDYGEWIYCFDPDLRKWSWWDITEDGQGKVCVWVDTKGEAHIPCEELWWAVYAAGAESTEPLTLEFSTKWQEQPSIGIARAT